MTTKHSVATAHGEIEYETVTCASCGTEVLPEDAKRLVVGDVLEHHEWHASGKEKFTFDLDTLAVGWACSYCRERSSKSQDGSVRNLLGVPTAEDLTLIEQFYRMDIRAATAILLAFWVCITILITLMTHGL